MDDWLDTILSRIDDGTLLPAAYYARLDCDAALDARDSDAAFEAEWLRQFEEVEQHWAGPRWPLTPAPARRSRTSAGSRS